MSDATRWEVSGSDADLLTQVDGKWIACDPDLDWTVVLSRDYDALAARLAEAERKLALKLPHGVKVNATHIGKGCALSTLALALDRATDSASVGVKL
jgi:hypothetical protein